MLYSATLGVVIAQACFATGENHERIAHEASQGTGSERCADQSGCAPHPATVFRQLREQRAALLLTVKAN
jgi:hypothetical protein